MTEIESELGNYFPETFFKLAQYAKQRNLLQPWERRLLFDVGIFLTKEQSISEKMGKQALRLLEECQKLGLMQIAEAEAHRKQEYSERSKFDTQKKFEESIRSPFTDEWSPARPYLEQAFELEKNGAKLEFIEFEIEKARQIDTIYTDTCLGRWAILKKQRKL